VSFILPSQLLSLKIAMSKRSAKIAGRTAKENMGSARGIQTEPNFYFQSLTEGLFAPEEQWLELFIECEIRCRT
jgi:hypothetical protein